MKKFFVCLLVFLLTACTSVGDVNSEINEAIEQVKNREILRQIMKKAGFIALPSEWWHFNAYPSKYVRENYNRLPF